MILGPILKEKDITMNRAMTLYIIIIISNFLALVNDALGAHYEIISSLLVY